LDLAFKPLGVDKRHAIVSGTNLVYTTQSF
jgi:hypothetical protein